MKWLLLFLLTCPAQAQKIESWKPNFQDKFCGLDTLHDSAYIDDCDAQQAQNVLTDRGHLEERTGNITLTTIANGSPVKQLYEYVSPSNARYVIAHAGNNVYQTNLSSTPVVLSTVAANQNLECTMLYGNLICDDGSGSAWYFNGTSTAPVNGSMPICNLLASEYGRVFCGAPSTDLSQVAVSSYPSYNVWTPSTLVPLPAQSATSFEFNPNDGDQILCLKTTPWGMFVGKKNSSYILKGYDNTTFFVQTIDPVIGCIDQRTAQLVNGVFTWMSTKGVYQWKGSGPPIWISEKIDPTFRGIRQLFSNSNFWELQTQADWQTGTFTTNGPSNTWDAVDNPGFIFPSSSTILDNTTAAFSSGTVFTNISTSDVFNSISLSSQTFSFLWNGVSNIGSNGIFTPNNGSFQVNPNSTWSCTTSGCSAYATSSVSTGSFSLANVNVQTPGTYIYWNFISLAQTSVTKGYTLRIDSSGGALLIVYPAGTAVATCASVAQINNWKVTRDKSGNFDVYANGVKQCSGTDTTYTSNQYVVISPNASADVFGSFNDFGYATTGTFQSRIFDTAFSTPVYGTFSSTYSFTGQNQNFQTVFYTRVSTSPNNDMWDGYVAASDTVKFGSAAKRYTQYESILTTFYSTMTPTVTGVNYFAISTGIYYSPVDFIGTKITSWKQFNIQDFQQTPGEFQYYVRSASYTFTPLSTTPAWISQVNNTIVNVATNTYFEWKVDSSSITSSSQAITTANASIDRSIINWLEGTASKPASGFMDQRYFLCVTLSTADTTNDGCLVLQRNNQWMLFNGPSISAMSNYNFQLIGGDGSSASKVWYLMQDGIYDDASMPINSSWTTKDFIVGSPFNQKSYYEIWTDNKYSQGATLNVGYEIDKSTMNYKTIVLDNSSNNPTQRNINTVITRTGTQLGPVNGNYIRFNFNQNQLDAPWVLNSYLFYTDVQNRTSQ